MEIIWYNPDCDQYQRGKLEDYNNLIQNHPQKDAFQLLYEFNATNQSMIEKILDLLSPAKKLQS
jgi:hypothetical protein